MIFKLNDTTIGVAVNLKMKGDPAMSTQTIAMPAVEVNAVQQSPFSRGAAPLVNPTPAVRQSTLSLFRFRPPDAGQPRMACAC